MEPKIGEKVYCYNTYDNPHNQNRIYQKGETYTVTAFDNSIVDPSLLVVWFDDNALGFIYPEPYNSHFYSIKQVRKDKLKNIEESKRRK